MIEVACFPSDLKWISSIIPRVNALGADETLIKNIVVYIGGTGEIIVPPLT